MFAKETRFLVVDDSFNIRRLIVDNLEKLGFSKIKAAEDANQAFDILTDAKKNNESFDIILSDLNMPGPSGLDFLKRVRGMEEFKTLPFILITTESEKGAVIEAAVNGVSAYIVKPFHLKVLSQRLREVWDKHYPSK